MLGSKMHMRGASCWQTTIRVGLCGSQRPEGAREPFRGDEPHPWWTCRLQNIHGAQTPAAVLRVLCTARIHPLKHGHWTSAPENPTEVCNKTDVLPVLKKIVLRGWCCGTAGKAASYNNLILPMGACSDSGCSTSHPYPC